MLESGLKFDKAMWMVGSYARLEWVIEHRNLISNEELYKLLPDIWRGSDPDDTDPRFLELWLEAWNYNKRNTIIDNKPLPPDKFLQIYRGQDENDAIVGIAWSLNKYVALNFARGAALRQADRPGIVYTANIKSEQVIAYLTGRNEDEIIVNPKYVSYTKDNWLTPQDIWTRIKKD